MINTKLIVSKVV